MLVAEKDMVCGKVAEPSDSCFFIKGSPVSLVSLKYGGVENRLVDAVHLGKELPCPVYRLVLEIIPEAPVAEHLEHGMVPSVMTYRFEVIVLSAYSETFLAVRRPFELGGGIAEEDVLELVHSCIGEHEGRVILYDHGRRGYYSVSLGCEKVKILLAYFF